MRARDTSLTDLSDDVRRLGYRNRKLSYSFE